MKDPMKDVTTQVKGSQYGLPLYKITNEGVEDSTPYLLKFCKGAKNDESLPRQTGFFTESLLTVCRHYLTDVNEGDLRNPLTTQAITRIDEAIQLLRRRSQQRAAAGVQNTMSPVGQIPEKVAVAAPHPLLDDADKQESDLAAKDLAKEDAAVDKEFDQMMTDIETTGEVAPEKEVPTAPANPELHSKTSKAEAKKKSEPAEEDEEW